MSPRQIKSFVIIFALIAMACSPSPERARAKIEAAGVTFDSAGFASAVMANDTKLVELFIAAGYDVNAFDHPREAPLMLAARLSHRPILKALIDSGARADDLPGILRVPSSRGEFEAMAMLLDAGAEIDAAGASTGTALIEAIKSANPESVRFLLDRGADPDGANAGANPIILSIQFNRLDIAELLLEAGANPRKGSSGLSAIEIARRSGHEDFAKRLEESLTVER